MKICHSEPAGPLRAAAYPQLGDQLDAIVALAVWMREQGMELPAKTVAWLDECEAVKERFRKPANE